MLQKEVYLLHPGLDVSDGHRVGSGVLLGDYGYTTGIHLPQVPEASGSNTG